MDVPGRSIKDWGGGIIKKGRVSKGTHTTCNLWPNRLEFDCLKFALHR